MRQPLIAGNWKMNGNRSSVETLLSNVINGASTISKTEVVVCPSFPFLDLSERLLSGTSIKLGAQNTSTKESGAYTGEVSASMLANFGCQYVICGHSERREYYGETDAIIAEKVSICVEKGMRAILCVGETLNQREQEQTESVISTQLDGVITQIGIDIFNNIEIAYEPVWAIGTGKTATPEQAQSVHAFIRQKIASHSLVIAEKIRILYGGSMKAENACDLLSQSDIDGGLIGGASLVANDFLAICRAGDTVASQN
ncbi:triose-phosphate isomerase [Chromatium okenii]|jgi:triosephosphate isomerase|uniref:Triosephosphate isomerase n=1 Tax=Chromatium okenii TaxID=61644 RepID=A0A2S7XUE9_9GAMM|nr:triose-phosphate isomerase [Chromatium okenii]PQJ97367.1 triose-phosphate isomerase [Chromatium okenii]